jgi:hypothetical protein
VPITLATWEAEIRRIGIRGQPRQDLISKISRAKKKKKGLEYQLKVD